MAIPKIKLVGFHRWLNKVAEVAGFMGLKKVQSVKTKKQVNTSSVSSKHREPLSKKKSSKESDVTSYMRVPGTRKQRLATHSQQDRYQSTPEGNRSEDSVALSANDLDRNEDRVTKRSDVSPSYHEEDSKLSSPDLESRTEIQNTKKAPLPTYSEKP